jgi:hypothetical protein
MDPKLIIGVLATVSTPALYLFYVDSKTDTPAPLGSRNAHVLLASLWAVAVLLTLLLVHVHVLAFSVD